MLGSEGLHGRVIRLLGVLIAMVLISTAVSACASSTNPSTLDPAAVVPGDVPLYVSAEVPGSAQLSQLQTIVTNLAGARVWTRLGNRLDQSLTTHKVDLAQDVAPWIGTHVGLAVTNLTALAADSSGSDALNGAVLVFPTNDMSAALAFAKQHDRAGMVAVADGHDMLISNAGTLAAFTAGSTAKLSASAGYQAVASRVTSDNATVYANVHAVASQLLAVPAIHAGLAAHSAQSARLTTFLATLPADATLAAGVQVTAHALTLDMISHDLGSAADAAGTSTTGVGSLPADSIIAAALNPKVSTGLSSTLLKRLTTGLGAHASHALGRGGVTHRPALSPLQRAGLERVRSRIGSILSSVLPALGRLRLALGRGKTFSFDAGPARLSVRDQAGTILGLLNEAGTSTLLSPSSTLSSSATYQSAVSQLPSGATVPFYISFSGLDTLLSGLPILPEQARQTLGKLNYLIVGTAPGDTRLVLGLN